jgi:predicted ribonuclease YlaK
MKTYNFYDTSSLLLKAGTLFEEEENVVISSITLTELEEIKSSRNKDNDIKYAARLLLHKLEQNTNKYEVVIYQTTMLKPIESKNLPLNNDAMILACAIWYDKHCHPDQVVFYTNDLALKNIANLFFGDDSISSIRKDMDDDYTGYKEIRMNEEEMGEFYSNLD